MTEITDYILILTLLPVAVCDIYKRKIPNAILITGTSLILASRGLQSLFCADTAAAFMALILLFPLFKFRMAGAGDIKLVAFVIFAKGIYDGAFICLTALFAAGAWSLFKLLRSGRCAERFSYFSAYMKAAMSGASPGPYFVMERDGKNITIAFALFVFAGAVLNYIF